MKEGVYVYVAYVCMCVACVCVACKISSPAVSSQSNQLQFVCPVTWTDTCSHMHAQTHKHKLTAMPFCIRSCVCVSWKIGLSWLLGDVFAIYGTFFFSPTLSSVLLSDYLFLILLIMSLYLFSIFIWFPKIPTLVNTMHTLWLVC